jgi:hypothetical protein
MRAAQVAPKSPSIPLFSKAEFSRVLRLTLSLQNLCKRGEGEISAILGYDAALVDSMPDAAVESFAGVANPFSLRPLEQGERVVDAGSGGGFDCFAAAVSDVRNVLEMHN